ncbi:MAG TPA: hypothetical protein VN844_28785 [Pyrinomonadaceae bacterium]|nr:hypothetical protein [Pyrinomonadaceae bacterium]
MDQPTVAFGRLKYLPGHSRAEQWTRICFRAAIFLRMVQPLLVLGAAAILVVISTVCPAAAQTGGPIISGGNPNAPIAGIQNLVTLGVWLLIAAGIGGIGWALINGMRRQSWGAQLIFGAACLGFGGIVALWNEYANGRSPDLPAF